MAGVVIGVILLALWLLDVGPVGAWPWWLIALPFGGAMLWWWWADSTGWTKRREMDKMDARKAERRAKNMQALGMDTKGRRRR
jgi:small Trp-rich protein